MASILLADDDSAVRELVKRALTGDGHTVYATQDGLEASEYLSANAATVDLLVSDVDMPQMDGVTLATRAIALKPSLAVVLMSGFSDQLEKVGGLKAARVASIAKPFTLEQIRQVVRGVLR